MTPEVEYPHSMNVSDFERQWILDFRSLMQEGFGNVVVKVHDHRLVAYEPMRNPGVKQFAEAKNR